LTKGTDVSPIIAGILVLAALAATAVVAVAVPVLLTVLVREIATTMPDGRVDSEPTLLSIAMKRGAARAFVVAGGAFWSLASFAGLYSYQRTGLGPATIAALYPLVGCAVTLVVGWYFERIVSIMLVIAAQAVVVWGVLYQFEPGVWVIMTLALIGPMLTAAVLFWLARGDQEAFESTFAARPELGLLVSARSTMRPLPIAA
jgi:hypothetical protein